MKLSIEIGQYNNHHGDFWDIRMGSAPVLEQVSRPVGHPKAAEASAGVSETWSPEPEQPPWKVWYSPTQWPVSCVRVCH